MIDTALMRNICHWLKANGIEPATVPITEVPVVTGDAIRLRVWDRPPLLDPSTNEPRGRVMVKPLVSPAKGAVRDWLDGKRRLER